jgi:YegS/Rv2252/BmrU family lipid kinase
MKKEILLIVNPCAGKGRINKYIPDICDNLEKQGFNLEVVYTSKEVNGEAIIKNYVRYIDTVIVCGGDGTLSEVINGVIASNKKINVTFIPFGTTNDFAKTLKMSTNKYKLSKNLSKYKKEKIDVGSCNNRFFYYVAAFGMFSDISYTTKQKEKNRLGKLAYVKDGFKEFRGLKKAKAYKVSIVTDNEIIQDEFIAGGITNSISIAGIKWFKKDEISLNDGIFEVILIKKPNNFNELVRIILSIFRKKYDQRVIYFIKTQHLKMDFEEPITWTLDGEKGETTKDVLIQNNKNKIGMLIPKII